MSRTGLFHWARSLNSKASSPNRRRTSRPASRRLRLEALEDRLALATFLVLNTNDIGADSLRQAILDANGSPGADVINFNIAGAGVHTISPASALPTITDPVVIDGYTQPGAVMNTDPLGFNGTLLIELNGASAGPGAIGLTITAGNSTVRGLVVNRFLSNLLTNGDGIQLATNGGNHVEGNFIGTDPTASSDLGNVRAGVRILDSAGNTIGGLTPAARNVICGNNDFNVGLFGATSGQNLIQGNLIGTNAAGSAALGGGTGVRLIDAPDNTIGGTAAGARNVISGLGNDGIEIVGSGANNTFVQGNFIGTNASGTAALQNFGNGVRIVGATNTTIGGTTTSARNVISGNRGIGVAVFSGPSVVQKNFIGVAADGTSALANLEVGVRIEGSNNTILENSIAFNNAPGGEGGVIVVSGTANAILANSIFGNTGLGIDLARNGVTANDTNDPDTGPNNLQNFPVLTSVTSGGGTTTFQGTLNSLPNTNFRIEFFASTAADPSGFAEGQNFVGFTNVTTDPIGNATFSFAAPTPTGTLFTSTATRLDANFQPIETSEFSVKFTAAAVAPTVTINQAAGQADPTNASPILFTVVFSTSVTGFTDSDVSLAGSSFSGLVAGVSGSGTTYTVAVTGMNGVGTVVASIGAGAAMDANNTSSAASTSSDNSVSFDSVAPTVTINQAVGQADPTSTSPILFTVVFSTSVTGFTDSDVSLAGSSFSGLVAGVSGSGTTYTVAVTGMNGVGTVVASIGAGAAVDANNTSSAASTSSDNSVTVTVPGPKAMTLTITLVTRQAKFKNEFGLYFVDDAAGRIGTLMPGDAGYARAAIGRTKAVFTTRDKIGAKRTVNLPAGGLYGTYLVQNATRSQFLARNPFNLLSKKPLMFFSFAAASADGFDHVRRPLTTRFAFEDQTGGGDRDFNDSIVDVHARAASLADLLNTVQPAKRK